MKKGKLEVICGPMWAGKSEELQRRIRRHRIAGRKTVVLRPNIDDRYSADKLVSHSGISMDSYSVEPIVEQIWANGQYFDVIGVDEVQFFSEQECSILEIVPWFIDRGKILIVTGLDMDYKREPFGCVPDLLAVATRVDKLTAICTVCGSDAQFTQRNSDEKEQIVVGGSEAYTVRCAEHHYIAIN